MIKVSFHVSPSYWNRRALCSWIWQTHAILNIDAYGSKVVKRSSHLSWESMEKGICPLEIKSILWLMIPVDGWTRDRGGGGRNLSKWSSHVAKSESNQLWSILCNWCKIPAGVLFNTQSKETPLQKAETLWNFLSPLEGQHKQQAHTGGGPNGFALHAAQISSLTLGIHEVRDEIEIPMHRLVLSQLWLHLGLPVDQGLQSVHELAWNQQGLPQLVLPEASTHISPLGKRISLLWGFPGDTVVKNPPVNAGHRGSISRSGRSPGVGNASLLQYSCRENPMDRGAWQATVHRVMKSWTWLSNWAHESNLFYEWPNWRGMSLEIYTEKDLHIGMVRNIVKSYQDDGNSLVVQWLRLVGTFTAVAQVPSLLRGTEIPQAMWDGLITKKVIKLTIKL